MLTDGWTNPRTETCTPKSPMLKQVQQKWLCAQRRLRSAWASAQSDQSLRCPHEERLGPWLPNECRVKTLIRLGRCPSWSESLLGAHSLCWFCHVLAHMFVWRNMENYFINSAGVCKTLCPQHLLVPKYGRICSAVSPQIILDFAQTFNR